MEPILFFTDEYAFLSNFYPAEFVWDGIVWSSSEHAYQAAKVTDRAERLRMSKIKGPGAVKREGKVVEIRDDWEDVKVRTMYQIVYAKFNQNSSLREKLLATEDAYLEEGNTWGDRFWGTVDGIGQNQLGLVLMKVRDELKESV